MRREGLRVTMKVKLRGLGGREEEDVREGGKGREREEEGKEEIGMSTRNDMKEICSYKSKEAKSSTYSFSKKR